jgi:hypothetical protein
MTTIMITPMIIKKEPLPIEVEGFEEAEELSEGEEKGKGGDG